MPIATYDPGQVTIIVRGNIIVGFAEDSMVEVERAEDSATLKIGAAGDGALAINRNRSGTIKITLLQTSPSNDILSAAAKALERNDPTAVAPAQVADGSGRTLVHAQNAWVQKPSPAKFGKEIEGREWTIQTDNLEMDIGGNG